MGRWYKTNPEESKAYIKQWVRDNPDRVKAYKLRWAYRRMFKAYIALGGECCVCGEDDPSMLQIDHVNNDGKHHRNRLSHRDMYKKIADGEIGLDVVQLLCANCHQRKTREEGLVDPYYFQLLYQEMRSESISS